MITLLVMVASAAQHSDRRNAIRQTWAYSLSGVKVIFLLGQGQDQQTKIQSESELYNDIIQEDFQVCDTVSKIKTVFYKFQFQIFMKSYFSK